MSYRRHRLDRGPLDYPTSASFPRWKAYQRPTISSSVVRRKGVESPQIAQGPGGGPVVTVPAGEVWEVLGIRVSFAADATVANRFYRLVFTDTNGSIIYETVNTTPIVANQVGRIVTAPTAFTAGGTPNILLGAPYGPSSFEIEGLSTIAAQPSIAGGAADTITISIDYRQIFREAYLR